VKQKFYDKLRDSRDRNEKNLKLLDGNILYGFVSGLENPVNPSTPSIQKRNVRISYIDC
jgi:hypothetical protein